MTMKSVSLAAGFAIGLCLFVCYYPLRSNPAAKTAIERERGHGDEIRAVTYTQHGNYVDVRFTDEDQDGRAEKVTYLRIDGTPLATFNIDWRDARERADPINYSVPPGERVRVEVDLDRHSNEARRLQSDYQSVVRTYAANNPSEVVPEKDVSLGEARPENVKRFGAWVDEWLARGKAMQRRRPGRFGELDQYYEYLSEGYMASAYRSLTDRERDSLFYWDAELPNGIDVGRKLANVLFSRTRWPRNPRARFEQDLDGFQEIDYMNAWSIAPDFNRLRKEYESDARRRGLAF